jgi:hypothetical protein
MSVRVIFAILAMSEAFIPPFSAREAVYGGPTNLSVFARQSSWHGFQ